LVSDEGRSAPPPVHQRELAAKLGAASRNPSAGLRRWVGKYLLHQKLACRPIQQGLHCPTDGRGLRAPKHRTRYRQCPKQRPLDLPSFGARHAGIQLGFMELQQKVEIEETIEFGAELVLAQAKGVSSDRVGRREAITADAVALEPLPAPP